MSRAQKGCRQLTLLGLNSGLTSLELCAGGGGQAIGLEAAGFYHVGLVEVDRHAIATLKRNRPEWNAIRADLSFFDASAFRGSVDLLAGGLPCPPWSRAGKQHGEDDERNLWPAALRIVGQVQPRAVMFENVRGILDSVFDDFRARFASSPELQGYRTGWKLLNACDFGVPQLRPRVLFVAIRGDQACNFDWPEPTATPAMTVGATLFELMKERGWHAAGAWKQIANDIAPTIVGGSMKHGGPDLGPTRARRAWAALGIDGLGIANSAPEPEFIGSPRLTVAMVAKLQGFPEDWIFEGGKTAAYRQVGNAFPPPVAYRLGLQLRSCLSSSAEPSPSLEIAI